MTQLSPMRAFLSMMAFSIRQLRPMPMRGLPSASCRAIGGADGADVFPRALVNVCVDAMFFEGEGNDVFAEIVHFIIEQPNEDVAAEDVDAHRGQEKFRVGLNSQFRIPVAAEAQLVLERRV